VTTSQIPAIETVAVRRVYAAKPKPIVALDGIDLVVISSVGGPGSLFADVSGHALPTTPEIVVALLLSGALVTLVAGVVFRVAQRRVTAKGLIDLTTGS
jgi:hypothetical protein